MSENKKYNELIKEIEKKTGKTKQEIEEKVKQKQEKFSGVLNSLGALYLVAKQENIELNASTLKEKISLSELEEGMQGITIEAEVQQIFEPKKFSGKKGKGILCSILLKDGKKSLRLTLWNEKVKDIEKLKLEKGDTIIASDCYTTSFKGLIQLNLSQQGNIKITKKGIPPKTISIKNLAPDMENVRIKCRILKKYEKKSFKNKKGTGSIARFLAGDRTGKITCVAWNDLAEKIEETLTGTGITIDGAYTKNGFNGTELHLGWNSRITKNEEVESIEEITKTKNITVNQLEKNKEKTVSLNCTIIGIPFKKNFFMACPECRKSTSTKKCENCGFAGKPEKKPLVKILLSDLTGTTTTTLFEEQLKQITEKKVIEGIENKEFLEKKLVGKNLKITGIPTKNPFNNKIEIKTVNIAIMENKENAKKTLASLEAHYNKKIKKQKIQEK